MIGRIPILDVQPVLDCGRRPAKAVSGETFEVSATVFREGHEMLGAGAVLRCPDGGRGPLAAMRELAAGTDRYGADVTVTSTGRWHFRVEAWGDPIAGWRHDAAIKVPIGQDTELMLARGALLFERAARHIRPSGNDDPAAALTALGRQPAIEARAALEAVAARLRDPGAAAEDRLAAALSPEVTAILAARPLRDLLTRSPWFPVIVHRQRALYGAWYEFFPRSEGAVVDAQGRAVQHGTFRTAAARLPAIAKMGFDIVYLPPVHRIDDGAQGRQQHADRHSGDRPPGHRLCLRGHDALHRPGTPDSTRLSTGRASRA